MPKDMTNEYRTIQTSLNTAAEQVNILLNHVQEDASLEAGERLQKSQSYSQALVSINLLRTQFPQPK